jgi:hypothetical protein
MGKSSGDEVLSVPSVTMCHLRGLQSDLRAFAWSKVSTPHIDVWIDFRGLYARVARFSPVGTNSGRYKKTLQE